MPVPADVATNGDTARKNACAAKSQKGPALSRFGIAARWEEVTQTGGARRSRFPLTKRVAPYKP